MISKLLPEGLGTAVEEGVTRMRKDYVAVTDGSEKRPRGTYGWYMVGKNEDYCSAGKVQSHTRDMDSYRAELHGLMSVMAGAWSIKPRAAVKVYCDNESVVKGYHRMRAALGERGEGEPPVYRHSVDLWDEVAYWSRKWGDQLEVEWMRGHPELRKERDSWDMLDWMNHAADRIAEAEYDEEGGVDAPECFQNQGKWRLEWREHRITSMTMDALDDIQLESLAEGAAAEQRIQLSAWDLKSTITATGWTGSARRRAWSAKLAWDRAWHRANRMHWKAANRKKREGALSFLAGEKEAWCRACSAQEVEDARHIMTRCGCEAYRTIRRRWYGKVVEKAKELSVALEASFVAVVANSAGVLQEGEGSSGLTAWDAVSGRIPILWTASVEKAGVKREDYEKWLRWYGASVKEYMWKPLWQMRQQKEKEQDAPLAAAAEVAQGGSRGSRAARRLRGGSRGSYRGGASRMSGRGSNRPRGGR